MTGFGDDYIHITALDNLLVAYRKAAKGKRGHSPAATFAFQLAHCNAWA